MFVALRAACLLAAVGLFAGALAAQTYTRTQTSEAYAERTGNAIAATRIGDLDDGAWQVALPFSFPWFDRTCRQVFMTSNGSVAFGESSLTSNIVFPLTPPVGVIALQDAIHVFRTDLAGNELLKNFTAHAEPGRVVLQWRKVASKATAGACHFNFQCHLLSNGTIELHYGPEIVGFDQTLIFVSGLVDATGNSCFAGFGNTLTAQTSRPAANDVVTFVPSGFVQQNGVEVSVRAAGLPAQTDFKGLGSGRVVGSFTLTPRGAGGTVSSITVQHFAAGLTETFDLLIYRDMTNAGFLDAADVPIGGGAQSMAGSTSTTFTISEPITSIARHYLLVVNNTSFSTYYARGVNSAPFVVLGSGLTVDTSAWGQYRTEEHEFAPGHVVRAGISRCDVAPSLALPGAWDRPLLSFELRNQPQFGNAIVTQFQFALSLAGLLVGDITDVALWRDLGRRGYVDSDDRLLSHVTNPLSTNINLPASEWISNSGSDYLLTFTLNAASVAEGTVSAALVGLNFSTGVGALTPSGVYGNSVLCSQTGTTLLLRERPDARIDSLPVAATQANLPANAFNLITSFASTTVTSLVFRGDTTGLSAARLYLDNGGNTGRFDAGDTQVGGTPTIVSGMTGSVTFTFATPLAVNAGGSDLLLVVDLSGATPGSTVALSLDTSDIATVVPTAGVNTTGNSLVVQAGSANGVNITGVSLSSSVTLGPSEMKVLGTVQLTARGTGGGAPDINLAFLDAAGGVGDGSGFVLYMYLEGSGPLGALDSTDLLLNINDVSPFSTLATITLLDTGSSAAVTATRNILLCVRRHTLKFGGTATVAWRGFTGGTDVQLAAIPDALRSRLTATFSDPAKPAPPSDEPPRLEPSCTSGEATGLMLVATSLLAALWLARRRRFSA